ncbi:hypothetical protein ACHAXT_002149 [Thalassiosira profunda]
MGKRGKSKASTASKKSGDKRKKSGEGGRRGRRVRKKSKQESKAANTKGKKQHELHVEFQHLLRTVATKASLWLEDSFAATLQTTSPDSRCSRATTAKAMQLQGGTHR